MVGSSRSKRIGLSLALVVSAAASAFALQSRDVTVISIEGRSTLPVSTVEGRPMVPLQALLDLVGAELRPGAENGAVISSPEATARITDGYSFVSVGTQMAALQSPTRRVSGEWFVPLDFLGKVLPSLTGETIRYRDFERTLILGDEYPQLFVRAQRDPSYTRVEVTTSRDVPIEVSERGDRVELTLEAPFLQTDFQSEELLDGVVDRIRLDRNDRNYVVTVELGDRFFELQALEAPSPDHGVVLNLVRSRVPTPTGVVGINEPETIEEDLRSVEVRESEDAPPGELEPEEGGEGEVPDAIETINLPPTDGTVPARDPLTNAERGPARLRVVTLDPGHGGSETGAEGRGGLLEKDVVLSLSRKLRRLLQERLGVRVLLTRDGDREIPLDERASIANNNKADLFVSIHADASPRREARGSSVYFLSYGSARDQTRGVSMAQGGGASASRSGAADLDFILWDMAQASHLNQSSTLAEALQEELIAATGAEKINRGIKQNTFRVLKGATMPAVLVEVGFISNPDEEDLLATEAYQEKLAEALYRGVLRFKDIYEYEPRAEQASRGRK